MLRIINFAHGAQYMLGAFVGYLLLTYLGLGYWFALFLVPLAVGLFGIVIEKLALSRLYKLDHLYGLLFTFGLALILEGLLRYQFGVSGRAYSPPPALVGGTTLGFIFLPNYRAWVIVASLAVCITTWLVVEKTSLVPTYEPGRKILFWNLIVVVFAVVVIGGMGSIMGAVITGYMLGLAEGITKVIYPEASNTVIFVIMALVLLVRPNGLFGKEA